MSAIKNVSAGNFNEVLQSSVPVLVDFYADWCGPCKAQTPILEALAGDHTDDLTVVKVDVDAEAGLAQQFGVRSIPTLVLFKDGAPVETRVGVNTQAQLDTLVAGHR